MERNPRDLRKIEKQSNPNWPQSDTKLSDGEASVLEHWWMWSTPSLPLLPGPLWLKMVIPVRAPSTGQIEIFNCLVYLKLFNCVQTNDY